MTVIVRDLLNADALATWARAQGFKDLRPEVWHLTVVKVRPAVFKSDLELDHRSLEIPKSLTRTVEGFGNFVVLTISSRRLATRHAALRPYCMESDRREYRPHITFAVGATPALATVQPFGGALRLGPEVCSV
jgi:hypothetical protein